MFELPESVYQYKLDEAQAAVREAQAEYNGVVAARGAASSALDTFLKDAARRQESAAKAVPKLQTDADWFVADFEENQRRLLAAQQERVTTLERKQQAMRAAAVRAVQTIQDREATLAKVKWQTHTVELEVAGKLWDRVKKTLEHDVAGDFAGLEVKPGKAEADGAAEIRDLRYAGADVGQRKLRANDVITHVQLPGNAIKTAVGGEGQNSKSTMQSLKTTLARLETEALKADADALRARMSAAQQQASAPLVATPHVATTRQRGVLTVQRRVNAGELFAKEHGPARLAAAQATLDDLELEEPANTEFQERKAKITAVQEEVRQFPTTDAEYLRLQGDLNAARQWQADVHAAFEDEDPALETEAA